MEASHLEYVFIWRFQHFKGIKKKLKPIQRRKYRIEHELQIWKGQFKEPKIPGVLDRFLKYSRHNILVLCGPKNREIRPKGIDFIYNKGILTLLQTYVHDAFLQVMGLPLGRSMDGEPLGARRMWQVIFSQTSHAIIYPIPLLQCDIATPPSRGRGLHYPRLNGDRSL